ncbi:MAG: G-D-S-L family lipolytic protein [Bacteroidetes bacterium]|nr:MAG: G-D-S-L family lipolytic protein [Bacteroidota bacterium]
MHRKVMIGSILVNILFLIGGLVLVQKLGGFRYLWYRIQNRGLAEVYDHRKNLFEMMPPKDSVTIFLGNSLTAYGEWAELFGRPDLLNRGIPGDGVEGVLARLPEVLRHRPDRIFLMIGINDLFFHEPDRVLKGYERLIDEIREKSPRTHLFVQSLLPVNNDLRPVGIKNETIQKLNKDLADLAKKKSVRFINLYPHFVGPSGALNPRYSLDGIHLNGEGYLIWKAALEKYVLRGTY